MMILAILAAAAETFSFPSHTGLLESTRRAEGHRVEIVREPKANWGELWPTAPSAIADERKSLASGGLSWVGT